MLRMVSLAAAIAATLIMPSTPSFARGGHGGGGGGGWHGGGGFSAMRGGSFGAPAVRGPVGSFGAARVYGGHRVFGGPHVGVFPRRHFGFRRYGGFYAGYGLYGGSCWRWRPTPYGWRRVRVCGYPYYSYIWPYRYYW